MSELKPCPFCGVEVDLCKEKFASLDGSTYCYWHVIHRCPHGNYSETKLCGTKAEAVRAWNRRAIPPTATETVDYLCDMCANDCDERREIRVGQGAYDVCERWEEVRDEGTA